MEIRAYGPADRSAVIDIFLHNTPQYFGADEQAGLEVWLNGQDEKRLTYKNTVAEHFFVLEHNGQITGCGGYYIVRDTLAINMVWGMVDPAFHKQGMGKLLFAYRVQQAKSDYPESKVLLDTTQHTYRFFEKQGFKTTKVTKDYYDAGLDRYDMELL